MTRRKTALKQLLEERSHTSTEYLDHLLLCLEKLRWAAETALLVTKVIYSTLDDHSAENWVNIAKTGDPRFVDFVTQNHDHEVLWNDYLHAQSIDQVDSWIDFYDKQ